VTGDRIDGLERLRERGLDELIVQPGIIDMERDLHAFAKVAGLSSRGKSERV
jgi:hypothetical protein